MAFRSRPGDRLTTRPPHAGTPPAGPPRDRQGAAGGRAPAPATPAARAPQATRSSRSPLEYALTKRSATTPVSERARRSDYGTTTPSSSSGGPNHADATIPCFFGAARAEVARKSSTNPLTPHLRRRSPCSSWLALRAARTARTSTASTPRTPPYRVSAGAATRRSRTGSLRVTRSPAVVAMAACRSGRVRRGLASGGRARRSRAGRER
jgi:hypothetical protein